MADASRPGRGPRRGRDARRARVETSSGGVVFRRADPGIEFLLIRDPYSNWGLPKGHIEGGETPEAAALREVEEETGLMELAVVTQLPTIDWYFRDRGKLVHKFCHFFLLECAGGEATPQLDEGITECVWRPPDHALTTISYANARGVMEAAAEWLRQEGDLAAGVNVEGRDTAGD
ncbi:MAG TPA: NUDIX hydrolase [Longimicrobiales bacterium]|nr:NUDIX hydrolase [Longimicrobiales bacterium]